MHVTAEHIIETLNRMVTTDPEAAKNLIASRVICNSELADDPTIQVGDWDGEYKVGLIGIINGFFPTNNLGYGVICAEFDQGGDLTGFRTTKESDWSDSSVRTDNHAPCSQDTRD